MTNPNDLKARVLKRWAELMARYGSAGLALMVMLVEQADQESTP